MQYYSQLHGDTMLRFTDRIRKGSVAIYSYNLMPELAQSHGAVIQRYKAEISMIM